MSAKDAAPAQSKTPTVPGFHAISVAHWGNRTDDRTGAREIGIRYCGTAEDLIAAGVATSQMLSPGRVSGGRKDPDGDSFYIDRYYRCSGGKPTRCIRLIFFKREEVLRNLPGATEAVAAADISDAAEVAEPASPHAAPLTPGAWLEERERLVRQTVGNLWRIGAPETEWNGRLADGYKVNTVAVEAFKARALEAQVDLLEILQSMKVERAAPRLRLVVDNTRRQP